MKEAERATGSKSERVLLDGSRRYDARVSIPVAGGKRKRISMSFQTERERDAWLIRELDKVDDGLSVARSRLSFADYLETWTRDRKDLKETTRAEYLRQIERIIRPRFGALKLQKLTSMALQEFYISLGERGTSGKRPLAATTVRRIHSLIHSALGKAVDDRLLRYNMATTAASSISEPEQVDKRQVVQPWTQEQVRRFRAVADQDELAALWRVLLVLGLRRGEAAGLTWGALELDAESPSLTVHTTRLVVNGSVIVDTPKTKKGRRTITMDARTASMLRDHRQEQRKLRMRMGEKWKGSSAEWCFTYTDPVNGGKPIHPDEIYDRFQELVRKAGVPRVKLHALRHLAASAMLATTQDINTVAGRIGHARASFTVDQYGHLLETADRSAADKSAAYMDA